MHVCAYAHLLILAKRNMGKQKLMKRLITVKRAADTDADY